jgi:hypothetical protein
MVLLRVSFLGIGPRRAPPLATKGPKDVVQQHGHTAQDSNRLGPKLQDVADLFPMPQDSSHQRGARIGWTEFQYVELMLDISYMDYG